MAESALGGSLTRSYFSCPNKDFKENFHIIFYTPVTNITERSKEEEEGDTKHRDIQHSPPPPH